MKEYIFSDTQLLPVSIEEAWAFFSSAKNLSKITPPELDFKILSGAVEGDIFEGMLIDYTVKPLFGIKVHWQTMIMKVNKPFQFMDRQLKGPYKKWEHTHTFTTENGITSMHDEVRYALPFGILGQAVHTLIVQKKIEQIFDYRKKVLNEIFKDHGNIHH